MNNLNSVLIEGNLTKDPDVNRTNNGTFVSTFPLACNRYYKADDELKEEVSFIDIETWGRLAENCYEYLKKGRGVRVVGRLKQQREAGIRYPVALTATLYHYHIDPDETLQEIGQSASGRLWDVLIMLRFLASNSNESTLQFDVLFQMKPDSEPEPVKLKARCHPGDNLEPVITIMYPEED